MVDLRDNSAQEVDPGPHNTLCGIDGLYWYKNSLIGVQSTGTYRVVRWFLSTDGSHVRANKVLETGTRLVSSPTTGAIRGSDFYYMANTNIDNYDDGKIVDPAKLEPVHIAVVPLAESATVSNGLLQKVRKSSASADHSTPPCGQR